MVMSPEKIKQLIKSNFAVRSQPMISNIIQVEGGRAIIHSKCHIIQGTKFYSGRLPVLFKSVYGDFIIRACGLSTLEGCPTVVEGNFNCSSNELTNMIGGPEEVESDYICISNPLTSLEGLPKIAGCFRINIDANIPLLRLIVVPYSFIFVRRNLDGTTFNPIDIEQILTKYQSKVKDKYMTRKAAVISCQKELIDNGFTGNASW
jgi:hypothetical protein